MPAANPLPIQFTPFRKEDFASDSGVSFINQSFSQIFTTINALLGAGGPTLLPSGIDVRGAKVTGLAAPSDPTDAVSAGHAASAYSPAAQQPQLDLGGKYCLKGLAAAYQSSQANSTTLASIQATLATGVTGTVTLAKLTGGGTDGSLTFTQGLITAYVAPT